MSEVRKTVIQPSEIIDLLGVTDRIEAERIISATLDFLIYLKVGDSLHTSNASFEKLSEDMVYLNVHRKIEDKIADTNIKNIIMLPGV